MSNIHQKKWKIHGIDSVYGLRHTANTNKFYGTYEEAVAAAARCFDKDDACEAIVIFEAIKIVRPIHQPPPIVVEDIL